MVKSAILRMFIVALVASLITVLCLISFFMLYILVPSSLNTVQISSQRSSDKSCEFALVYNKPPKTASSYIQEVIADWAKATGRGNYMCSSRPTESNVVLQECIPPTGDSCGVLNCHIFLDSNALNLLQKRLPDHKLLTSTRYPPHRIVSFYLQMSQLKADDDNIWDGLREYLRQYDPWRLYNYHTGEARTGSCPLSRADSVLIFTKAARYDIVVDANLRQVSNAILRRHGLFTLPAVTGERNKDRGAYKLNLPSDVKDLLRNVVCVETELHRAFQMRMASLYEDATGKPCKKVPKNCIEDLEYEALNQSWVE